MSTVEMDQLRQELSAILVNLQDLNKNLEEEADDGQKTQIQERITAAETAKTTLKDKILRTIEADCLLKKDADSATSVEPGPSGSKSVAENSSETASSTAVTVGIRDAVSSSSLRIKLKQPKEYKNGEDFSTFGYRFKIFVESNRTDKTDYSNALLSCVDDITLQKLMPVVDALTDREKQDIRVLLDRCRETLYPKSEMRALRQQLTSAKIVQSSGEEVEEFAAKIRSLVNRAGYTTEAEKSEACLNAFLNGLNADLAEKLYAAPDVENRFEIAVSTARKLEKMRKVRNSSAPVTPELESLGGVFRVSHQPRGSRAQEHYQRSDEQQQVLSQLSNYNSQQRDNRGSGSRPPSETNHQSRSGRRGRGRSESRTCHRCGVSGHIARFCRAPAPLNM